MYKTFAAAVTAIAILLTGCAAPEAKAPVGGTSQAGKTTATPKPPPVLKKTATPAATVRVSAVVDGDTIKLATGKTVRLIGIDTPERGQCGYDLAREHLRVLLADDPVLLVSAPNRDDKDKYGRLLRYVIIPTLADEDAGLNQIASGLATARYDSRDGYGRHPKQSEYIKADAQTPAYKCPKATPTTKPKPTATKPTAAEAYYANCAAARAAGVAPLHRGDPGYRSGLDRDNDGTACE